MRVSRLAPIVALVPALALAQAAPPAGGDPPKAETYTVQRGDTLWDLSARFLGTPWYWPKVWSYNPQIANPHFIYPGNVVRFLPAGDDTAGRVELVAPGSGQVAPEADLEAPRELDGLSLADMKRPQQIGDGDEVAVVGPYKIGYVPPKGVYARRESFVTQRELEQSGRISAAFEEKLLLTVHDRAYARFAAPKAVQLGERYVVYRTERPVRHPVSGELFGYKSSIIGAARVVAVDDRAVTIEVTQAFDPIERGDLLGPWMDKLVKQVQRRPNQRQLSGVIVATQQELVTEIGEHHVVFVDKGREDGVEEGNVFTVVRSGDPYGREPSTVQHDPALPIESVGSLMVVDAQQTSSAALVVRSLRELYVGDRVEMIPAAGPPSASAARP